MGAVSLRRCPPTCSWPGSAGLPGKAALDRTALALSFVILVIISIKPRMINRARKKIGAIGRGSTAQSTFRHFVPIDERDVIDQDFCVTCSVRSVKLDGDSGLVKDS